MVCGQPVPDRLDSAETMAWRDQIGREPVALPIDQRETFLLKYVEGLNYEEMPTLTGVGESWFEPRRMF